MYWTNCLSHRSFSIGDEFLAQLNWTGTELELELNCDSAMDCDSVILNWTVILNWNGTEL